MPYAKKRTPRVKPKTKVDKRQDNQIRALRKMVVGQKELVEDTYQTNKATVPSGGALFSLINYDNEINYIASSITSRTYYRLNSRVLLQGNQSQSAGTLSDTSRPVRVIFFQWKADVVSGVTVPYNVVQPTMADLFDDYTTSNEVASLKRMSYKNRNRIRIIKDYTVTLTNHSGATHDVAIRGFDRNFKYGLNIKRFTSSDSAGPAKVWMPYYLIFDGHGANPLKDNAYYTVVNTCLYNEEVA